MGRKILFGFIGFGILFTALTLWRVNHIVVEHDREQIAQKAQVALDLLSESVRTKIAEYKSFAQIALNRGALENNPILLVGTFDAKTRELDQASVRESPEVKGWGTSYAELALQGGIPDVPPSTDVLTIMNPLRKTYLLFIWTTKEKSFVGLTSPADFQSTFDQLKTAGFTFYLFNTKGFAIAHTESQYVGAQMRDVPLVSAVLAGETLATNKQRFVSHLTLPQMHLTIGVEKTYPSLPEWDDMVHILVVALALLAVGSGILMGLQKRSNQAANPVASAPTPAPQAATPSAVHEPKFDPQVGNFVFEHLASRFKKTFLENYQNLRTTVDPQSAKMIGESYDEFEKLLLITSQKEETIKMGSLADAMNTEFRAREKTLLAKGMNVQKNWQSFSPFPYHIARTSGVHAQIWDFLTEKLTRSSSKKISWDLHDEPSRVIIIWKLDHKLDLTDGDRKYLEYLSPDLAWTNDPFRLTLRVKKGAATQTTSAPVQQMLDDELTPTPSPRVLAADENSSPQIRVHESPPEIATTPQPVAASAQSIIDDIRMSDALRAMDLPADDITVVAPPFLLRDTDEHRSARENEELSTQIASSNIDRIVEQSLSTARAEKLFSRKTRIRKPGEGART